MAEEERIGGQSLVGAHSVEDRSIRSHIKGKSVAVFFDDYNDEIAVSARDQLKSAGAKVKLIPMSVPYYEWVARNNNLKYGDVASLDAGHQIKEMLKELVPLKVKYKSDLSDDIDLALYFFGH